jgi:uroporphyrinogen-III synthase
MAEEMRSLPARSVAVQEYGVSNGEFLDLLRSRNLNVTPVTIYRWELPADTSLLEMAAHRLAAGEFDIVLLLSSVQLTHLLVIGDRLGLREKLISVLRDHALVASIGPVMTDGLAKIGLTPDFEPKHPKLAPCIRELAERAPALVAGKRHADR